MAAEKAPGAARSRRRAVALAVCAVLTGSAVLVSCGGDGDDDGSEGFSPTPTAADTSRFSGEPPSALSCAQDLAPGEKAHPLAISAKPPEPRLTAKVAQAERY
ncbi:hypothetical protein ACFYWD_02410 [Streptomyces sp. NPDC003781]|uniref:hypothetical protein n=1 Tax=Streptomyces sp. NPDC003781 TaxID=3364686 RepID=UPI0036AC397A